MWKEISNRSDNTRYELLISFSRVLTLYGFSYATLLFYVGIIQTAFVFLLLSLMLMPSVFFLEQEKFFTSTRFLFIVISNVYIYVATISTSVDINIESYYFPLMLLPLLTFKNTEKKQMYFSIAFSLVMWALGKGPATYFLPVITPNHLDQMLLSNINFVGAIAITIIFLNYYQKYLNRATIELEKSLNKKKLLVKHLQDTQRLAKIGNWDLNLKQNTLIWSDEIFNIFEIDKAKFAASYEAFLAAVHPDDRDAVDAAYTKSLESKVPYEIVHRLLMNDGRVKVVREQCETVYDLEGKAIRSLGTVQDISESQEKEAILYHSNKMASLGEMAGGIAHEINNPLTLIRGKASVMLRNLASGEIDKENLQLSLEKIISSVERISKIIIGLKSISRNSENDEMKNANLKILVDEVLDICHERFKDFSVDLRLDLSPNAIINCKAAEISQVLLNLISNSFDAISTLEDRWIKIEVSDLNPYIKITITDSGNGIPKVVLEKLMQPFFTTKEVGKGTGLGLNISRKIVEKHHGKLYYDPESKNTSFVIELPKPLDK